MCCLPTYSLSSYLSLYYWSHISSSSSSSSSSVVKRLDRTTQPITKTHWRDLVNSHLSDGYCSTPFQQPRLGYYLLFHDHADATAGGNKIYRFTKSNRLNSGVEYVSQSPIKQAFATCLTVRPLIQVLSVLAFYQSRSGTLKESSRCHCLRPFQSDDHTIFLMLTSHIFCTLSGCNIGIFIASPYVSARPLHSATTCGTASEKILL